MGKRDINKLSSRKFWIVLIAFGLIFLKPEIGGQLVTLAIAYIGGNTAIRVMMKDKKDE